MRRFVATATLFAMAPMLVPTASMAGDLEARAYVGLSLSDAEPLLGVELLSGDLPDVPVARLSLLDERLEVAGLDAHALAEPVMAFADGDLEIAFYTILGIGAVVGLVIAADNICIAYNSDCPDDDDEDDVENAGDPNQPRPVGN